MTVDLRPEVRCGVDEREISAVTHLNNRILVIWDDWPSFCFLILRFNGATVQTCWTISYTYLQALLGKADAAQICRCMHHSDNTAYFEGF